MDILDGGVRSRSAGGSQIDFYCSIVRKCTYPMKYNRLIRSRSCRTGYTTSSPTSSAESSRFPNHHRLAIEPTSVVAATGSKNVYLEKLE